MSTHWGKHLNICWTHRFNWRKRSWCGYPWI